MDLYGQDAEVHLLAKILPRLATGSVVDVGAERGSFARAMLRAGADQIHAVEPEPRNVAFLRERFRDEPRVTIHDCAIGSADGGADLYISTDPLGEPLPFAHSLTRHADSEQMHWHDSVAVEVRSLASLVSGGEIPARVGILKVDAEGHDLAVLTGLGELGCDVIMTEHWVDLPTAMGPCPWSTEEMLAAVSARGFEQFAFFVHRGECTIVQWNDGSVPVGYNGNLVFIHDRVLDDVLPLVLESASTLARNLVEVAERRLVTIGEVARERDLQAATADERLATIEVIDRERALQAEVAAERLHAIETLGGPGANAAVGEAAFGGRDGS